MSDQIIVTLISTSGAVITGIAGMWIVNNQISRRIDRLEDKFDKLQKEFYEFREIVNNKFQALDFEISKLMDKIK